MIYNHETDASTVCGDYMEAYGKDLLHSQVSSQFDGFKNVHRRILLTMNKIDKVTKLQELGGTCVTLYHPKGDTSVTNAAIKMATKFDNVIPLLNTAGNVGSYYGTDAASPRYLDVGPADFTDDIFFKGIERSSFITTPCENGNGVEPRYLIPKIPMALLRVNNGICSGIKSIIIPYNFNAICDLTIEFIKMVMKNKKIVPEKAILNKKLSKFLMYDTPTNNVIRNYDAIRESFNRGVYDIKLVTDGIMDITPDSIILRYLPYGSVTCADIDNIVIGPLMCDRKDNPFNTVVSKINKGYKESVFTYTIELKKGCNPFDFLNVFKKTFKFTRAEHPTNIYLDARGFCKHLDPFDILEGWFKVRYNSIRTKFTKDQTRLLEDIYKKKARVVAAINRDAVLDIIKTSADRKESQYRLSEKFDITPFQASFILTINLGEMNKLSLNDLIKQADDAEKELEKHHRQKTPDLIIIDEIEAIKKKYGSTIKRKSLIPLYIGAVNLYNKGYIQVESIDERLEVINTFGQHVTSCMFYPENSHMYMLTAGGVIDNSELSLPKQFVAKKLITVPNKPTHTVVLRNDCLSKVNTIKFNIDDNSADYCLTDSTILTISNKGLVSRVHLDDITERKAIQAQGSKTDVKFILPDNGDDLVIVYANSDDTNTLRISRVLEGGKLRFGGGTTEILAITPTAKETIVFIPKKYQSRVNINFIKIPDGVVKSNDFIMLELNKKRSTNGTYSISKDQGNEHIYTLNNK